MYRSFTLAASLLAFIPTTVLAAGSAHVINNCGFDVFYASVAQNIGAAMQKLPSGGYSEPYSKDNVGISIKISTSLNGPVTQFEFTWDSPNINYDISNIDGNPFAQYGTSLVPSMVGASGYPTCVALSCPAGQATCQDAYNNPDDVKTKVCPDSSDLTFTLCPGGASSNAPPAQSSSSRGSAAPSVSVPASVPIASSASAPLSSSSAPAFSRPSATSSAPASFEPSTTPVVQTSFRTSAIQTSFRTFTTPNANSQVASSSQGQAPVASSVVQTTPAALPTTTAAADNGAQTTAPAAAHSWSGGSWGSWGDWSHHHHTRRAHNHRFRS